jgi:hypothetical protein
MDEPVAVAARRAPEADDGSLSTTERGARAWVLLLAFGAGAITLIATTHGLGLAPDSVAYHAIAQHIRADPGSAFRPGMHPAIGSLEKWPPGYPALLALIGATGAPLLGGARLVHAALASCLVLLVATVLRRAASWKVAAVAVTVILVTSGLITSVFALLMSEALFLVLAWAAIAAFDRAITAPAARGAATWMAGAWILVAAASTTRILGLALIPAFLLATLLTGRGRAPRTTLLIGAVLASLPALYAMTGDDQTGRATTFRFQSTFPKRLRTGLTTSDSWFVPHGLLGSRPAQAVATLALVVALGWAVVWAVRWLAGAARARGELTPTDRLTATLVLAGSGYLAMLLWNAMFIDAVTPLADRHLLPVWLFVVAVVALRLTPSIDRASWRAPLVVAALVLVLLLGAQSALDVHRAQRDGIGYAGTAYAAAIDRAITSQPRDLIVYSDRPDAVYVRTGRPARGLPIPAEDPSYGKTATTIGDAVRDGRAVVVYFDIEPQRSYFPTPEELAADAGLVVEQRGEDTTFLVAPS